MNLCVNYVFFCFTDDEVVISVADGRFSWCGNDKGETEEVFRGLSRVNLSFQKVTFDFYIIIESTSDKMKGFLPLT